MEHKKIQFLVPQYKEKEETISFLLDSIESQVYVDKKDMGVIICSDGGEYVLDQKFLDKYSYDIEYVICEHRGVASCGARGIGREERLLEVGRVGDNLVVPHFALPCPLAKVVVDHRDALAPRATQCVLAGLLGGVAIYLKGSDLCGVGTLCRHQRQ